MSEAKPYDAGDTSNVIEVDFRPVGDSSSSSTRSSPSRKPRPLTAEEAIDRIIALLVVGIIAKKVYDWLS